MSAPEKRQETSLPVADQVAQDLTEEEKKKQQQKEQKDKDSTSNKKKVDSWKTAVTLRGAVDVLNNKAYDIQVDQNRFDVYQLPNLDSTLHPYDLIETLSTDLKSTISDVTAFLQSQDPLVEKDGHNFHGTCVCKELLTPARFSLYSYYGQDGQIVFYLRQFDGCGISFARFFKQFNNQFGANKDRVLHTFEAPALCSLSELQMTQLEQSFSNLSIRNNKEDNCIFDHTIPDQTVWSIGTIKQLCAEIQRGQKEANNAHEDDGLLIPGHDDCAPLPLTNEAQSRMLTQAFSTLTGSLGDHLTAIEREQVSEFVDVFLTNVVEVVIQDDNGDDMTTSYPDNLCALLLHPKTDVAVALVSFLSTALQYGLVSVEAIEVFAPSLQQLYEHSLLITTQDAPVQSPFERISHKTITQKLEALFQQQQE